MKRLGARDMTCFVFSILKLEIFFKMSVYVEEDWNLTCAFWERKLAWAKGERGGGQRGNRPMQSGNSLRGRRFDFPTSTPPILKAFGQLVVMFYFTFWYLFPIYVTNSIFTSC